MTGQDASFVNAAESQQSLRCAVEGDAPGPSEKHGCFPRSLHGRIHGVRGASPSTATEDSACDNTKPFTNDAISADQV